MPDESKKGNKNAGIIGQYPYFAPDEGYLKKAPKMTKADELYLKKYMAAAQAQADARVEDTVLGNEVPGKEKPYESDPTINPRLRSERKTGSLTK